MYHPVKLRCLQNGPASAWHTQQACLLGGSRLSVALHMQPHWHAVQRQPLQASSSSSNGSSNGNGNGNGNGSVSSTGKGIDAGKNISSSRSNGGHFSRDDPKKDTDSRKLKWAQASFKDLEDMSMVEELEAARHLQQEFARHPSHTPLVQNKVQLSTYGDSLGTNLKDLKQFIDNNLQGVIGGVHLLPVYPSSGDGGFAPLNYSEVDPHFGTWEDVKALADECDLMLELMVNHISPASPQFQDYLEKGDASEFAPMFIDWAKFWGGNGRPTEEDLTLIRTRKPDLPMLPIQLNDGSKRELWCTFGPQQIDIDVISPQGKKFVEDSLRSLCSRGARMVRLDAYGYVTKKPGTRCFMEEPEAWEILAELEEIADEYQTRLLCEVHEEFQTNIALALRGFWVYDFALPLLMLHAFTFKTMDNLRHWLNICPRRQITVLDTHDGMGIDDIAGLADMCDVEELQEVVEYCLGCNPNMKYHYQGASRGYTGSPHQYNCTYYSALHGNPRHYLLARAIQFFTPGLPMVYYVGLLAGRNDHETAERDQNPRGINRHKFSLEEAEAATQQPVVQALFDLCRFRNEHKAFNGKVKIAEGLPKERLDVTWKNGRHKATLRADLADMSFEIIATRDGDDHEGDLHSFKYTLDDTDAYEMTVDDECKAPAIF